MSKDCLFTTLKGVINNGSLPKVGEIKIHINSTTSNIVGLQIGIPNNAASISAFYARLIGDAYFTSSDGSANYGQNKTATAATTSLYISAGEADLFISNKYDYKSFSLLTTTGGERVEIDIEELAYSQTTPAPSIVFSGYNYAPVQAVGDMTNSDMKVSALSIRYCNLLFGSLDKIIKNNTIGTINFADTNLLLDMSSLEGQSTLTPFSPGNYVRGNIKYHADIADTNIRITAAAAPNITGSIEDYVSRAIANGKTTGTRTFSVTSPKNFVNVTYQGISLADNTNVPSGSNKAFSWDAVGNVTWA